MHVKIAPLLSICVIFTEMVYVPEVLGLTALLCACRNLIKVLDTDLFSKPGSSLKDFKENAMLVKYRRLFWPTILLIALTSTALALVSVRAKRGANSRSELEGAANLAEPAKSAERPITKVTASNLAFPLIQGNQQPRIEAEIITIRPTGFEPTAITRPKGPFILEVEDRTGLTEVDVQLTVERGDRVFRVRAPRERSDWNRMVDLPPGRYVLSVVGHADWTCTITVTPQ